MQVITRHSPCFARRLTIPPFYAVCFVNLLLRCLLVGLFWLLAPDSRADQPRFRTSFRSRNGRYTFRVMGTKVDTLRSPTSKEKFTSQLTSWGLFDNETGAQVYQLEARDLIQTKTALLTDDGETIVVLDDWSAGVPMDVWPVLSFYQHGHEMQTYTLGQLLGPTFPVSESVSHFSWFNHYHFSPATATLTLQTFTLQELAFDGRLGQRLATKYSRLVTPGSQLAYGRIEQVGSHQYALTVCRPYYGPVQAQDRLLFRSASRLRTGDLVMALLDAGQSKYLGQRINSWWGEQVTCAPAASK
jgi:hypothetical protein